MARKTFKSLQTKKISSSKILITLICFVALPLLRAPVSHADITRPTNDAYQDLYPSWSPVGAKIAFASNRSGNFDIWIINPDGTGLTNLTNTPGADEKYPSWSPDGQYIAYSKHDPSLENNWGGYQLCIKKADGTGPEQALRLPAEIPFSDPQNPQYQNYWKDPYFIGNPIWSPDGTQILFQSYGPSGGSHKLYRYTLSAQEVVEVTPSLDEINSFGDIYRSSWSGGVITYDRYPIGIQTFVPDPQNPQEAGHSDYKVLIPSPSQIGTPVEPAWSPDGTKLAFTRGAFYEPNNTLVIYDRSKGLMIPLDQVVTNAGWPSWSPDGKKIVFVHDRNGNSDIWITTLPALPTAPRIAGTYTVYEYGRGFSGCADAACASWGNTTTQALTKSALTFNADGTFSSTYTDHGQYRSVGEDSNGNNVFQTTQDGPTTATETGTYFVWPDGSVTLAIMDNGEPHPITGYLGHDGNTFIFGDKTCDYGDHECDVSMGIGVKQGSGMAIAGLNGTYMVGEFGSGFGEGPDSTHWGATDDSYISRHIVTFDGAGNFTVTNPENGEIHRNIGNTDTLSTGDNIFTTTTPATPDLDPVSSGTYTVSDTGEVVLTFSPAAGGGTMTLYMSADANTVIFAENEFDNTDPSCELDIGVGIKQGSQITTSDLSGTYAMGEFLTEFHGHITMSAGWGAWDSETVTRNTVVFDGAGHYTLSYEDFGIKQEIGENSTGATPPFANYYQVTEPSGSGNKSGTYTVTPEGIVTFHFLEDGHEETSTAYLSSDKETIVMGEFRYDGEDKEASTGFSVGIKRAEFKLLEKGNIDGARGVDLTDAIQALKVLSGMAPTGIYAGGDVNGDGKIGLAEAVYILQSVAGLR